MLAFDDRINRARILLERRGAAPAEFLNPTIRESWSRCLERGLDPLGEPERVVVDRDALERLRAENRAALRLASEEVRNLYSHIAGSNFAIAFAAPDGTILECLSDESFHETADLTRIRPGSVWQEAVNGTNALGGVVHAGEPAIVHAGEHFFRCYAGLTCVAAPVFAPSGELAGIIDATSDCRSRQHHTLALVKMSCLTIENGLFRRAFRDRLIVELHNRHEFLGTLQAGLLAFAEDGALIAANRQARFLLQGIALAPGIAFDAIFRTPFRIFRDTRGTTFGARLVDVHGSAFAVAVFNPMTAGTVLPGGGLRDDRRRPRAPDRAAPRMVCADPAVRALVDQVERAAAVGAPIHIRGETGTGKELLARFVHEASGRGGAFIAVNCAALPESLAESELFGYRAGAFTGAAKTGAPGLVLQADGGTLFLDEIGDMPPALQATLLRFLDSWRIRPVGETGERAVDIQLVSATNRDLDAAIAEGRFRRDLLYRLNTVEVTLPPLNARSDFAEIVAALAETLDDPPVLDDAALALLESARWPGNIRELRNVLQRLALAEPGGGPITAERLRALLGDRLGAGPGRDGLRAREREIVLETYRRLDGNVSAVARALGVSRNTVYARLREARGETGRGGGGR